jgi:hypothetical protein
MNRIVKATADVPPASDTAGHERTEFCFVLNQLSSSADTGSQLNGSTSYGVRLDGGTSYMLFMRLRNSTRWRQTTKLVFS